MEPYGITIGETDVKENRPRADLKVYKQGGFYKATQSEIKRCRRRLKKKARQAGKKECLASE